MKSLVTYLTESEGDRFKEKKNVSVKQFETWKKKYEKDNNYEIYYSESDKVYAIYKVKDKSNPIWKGEHIGTYDCTSGNIYYDSDIFKDI